MKIETAAILLQFLAACLTKIVQSAILRAIQNVLDPTRFMASHSPETGLTNSPYPEKTDNSGIIDN
ncbi:MAG: hypothetical protein ACXWFI_01080 [Methylobacter sp.]